VRRTSVTAAAMIAAVIVLSACGTAITPSSSQGPISSRGAIGSSSAAPSAALPSKSVASVNPSLEAGAPCSPKTLKFDPKKIELTGPWAGDDAGIYYLRQRGSVLWWNGMSSRADAPTALGRDWNNVGRGEIKDLTIAVDWADVPRGGIMGYGTLTLKIEADTSGNLRLEKTAETGTGFGNNVWTPCTPG
jgi:hypothetical protein